MKSRKPIGIQRIFGERMHIYSYFGSLWPYWIHITGQWFHVDADVHEISIWNKEFNRIIFFYNNLSKVCVLNFMSKSHA